jgi:hypothetical protein
MRAKMKIFYGCRLVVAGLFILAMLIATVGCGTSSMAKYRASLQDTGGSRYTVYNGKFEHDFFGGRNQQVGKESWEDD